MEVTLEGMETEAKEVHPEKAYFPMEVTLEGMETEAREEQPEKAPYPMEVTLEGMETEVREEQFWKVDSPMEVTLDGMKTQVREEQPEKARFSMETTEHPFHELGMTIRLSELPVFIPVTSQVFSDSLRTLNSRKASLERGSPCSKVAVPAFPQREQE